MGRHRYDETDQLAEGRRWIYAEIPDDDRTGDWHEIDSGATDWNPPPSQSWPPPPLPQTKIGPPLPLPFVYENSPGYVGAEIVDPRGERFKERIRVFRMIYRATTGSMRSFLWYPRHRRESRVPL